MKVAVVGAGIAGLQAARRLHQTGCQVQLFDKSRGAGGRLSTRRTDHGPFDHGAQYMTAREPRFRAEVENWLAKGVAAHWEPRRVRFTEGGCKEELAPEARYVGVPGMSGIARALREDLPVELATRIERVRRAEDGWHLEDESGTIFGAFEILVVAVPAPQAVPLLGSHSDFAARARGVEMLPCHAVMVAFREPPVAHFDAATFDSGPLAWAARNASKPGREGGACWVLHSDAEWSANHVEAPAEYVQQTLLEAFGSVTGAGKSEIDFLTSHRWLYARPETPGPGSQWDAAQQIGICGDWLAGGRVEDAFMSGDRLADAILGSPREAPAHDLRPVHEER